MIEIASFIRELLAMPPAQSADVLRTAFAVIESVLAEGSESARRLIEVGLLESLQNQCSHVDGLMQLAEGWLGPASQESWQRSTVLYEGKDSLMEVVSQVVQAQRDAS